jgi:anaerobic dimethyl sulfoxide reductase subunit A
MWCHCHCEVDVDVKDGRLERISGVTDDPRSDAMGRLVKVCPRPRAAQEYFYHPDRLRYPLKRKGKQGEGRWQEISWNRPLMRWP